MSSDLPIIKTPKHQIPNTFTQAPITSQPLSTLHSSLSTSSPLRILYIDHCALMSGGEIALLNLVRTIDCGRYEPIVLLCSHGPLEEALAKAVVETHVMLLDPTVANTRKDALGASTLSRLGAVWATIKYTVRLARFIRKHRIDLIHANSLKADILGGFAAWLAWRPVIWHVRDRIDSDYLPPKVAKVFRLLCRVVPSFVIANSAATLATLGKTNPDNAVVYSGQENVVHDGFGSVLPARPAHRDADHPVIGLVGRITRWKGQDVFVRAAARVLEIYPSCRFRIIGSAMFGEGEYEAEVRELVASLGIGSSVEFTGFRRDITAAIDELDILVHASTTGEPFGQVIVEGMAAGKPVVATNGGGVPEIVLDGITGVLVPMGEHQPMADAIIHLLSNPTLASSMASAGLERVRDHFSIQLTVDKVMGIYDRLLR